MYLCVSWCVEGENGVAPPPAPGENLPGDMATLPCGDIATLPCGDIATLPCGDIATLPCGDMATLPSGERTLLLAAACC